MQEEKPVKNGKKQFFNYPADWQEGNGNVPIKQTLSQTGFTNNERKDVSPARAKKISESNQSGRVLLLNFNNDQTNPTSVTPSNFERKSNSIAANHQGVGMRALVANSYGNRAVKNKPG